MMNPDFKVSARFAPTLAVMGSELPDETLPATIEHPEGSGALLMAPPEGPARPFFEPFSRPSYWERQEDRVTLPADGSYMIAVWHPEGQTGRYVLIETIVLGTAPDGRPRGVGKLPIGPTGAAIANAVFALADVRLRELPLTTERVKAARDENESRVIKSVKGMRTNGE